MGTMRRFAIPLAAVVSACAGSAWMAEPLPPDVPQPLEVPPAPPLPRASAVPIDGGAPEDAAREPEDEGDAAPVTMPRSDSPPRPHQRPLGTFRNTYYDFPR